MEHTDRIARELRESRKQALLRRRLVFWYQDMRVAIYKYLGLDYSKVVGYPMTRREYDRWQKVGGIRYLKCYGYEVCSCFDGLSPHLPIGDGWVVCQRDSGRGFKCDVVVRSCL